MEASLIEAMHTERSSDRVGDKGARHRLLDAAEELFARRGVDGVSLREIAAAADQRNNSAVSYYFRDKAGLIDALIADRMNRVEVAREKMVAQAGDLDTLDVASLLSLIWQPVLALGQAKAVHWYIQFHSTHHIRNPGERRLSMTDPDRHPASRALHDALHGHCRHLPEGQFEYRLNLIAMMFWSAVSWHDSVALSTGQAWSTRFTLDEVIKIATPALTAPA